MSTSWLDHRRRKAAAQFAELGLPDSRDEAFKYTPLHGLKRRPDQRARASDDFELPHVGRPRLAFIDGEVLNHEIPAPLSAGPLSLHLDKVEGRLGQLLDETAHGLAALNLAEFRDGLYLHVAENTAEPVSIHLALGAVGGACSYRHLIHLEAGTQADLLITTNGDENCIAHLNEVTEVFLGAGARLDLTWVHRGANGLISTQELAARQEENSALNINLFALEAGTLRHGIRVQHQGDDASVRVAGLSLAQQDEHIDYHLDLQHHAARGRSAQCFRGLVNKGGRVVVSGKVTVGEAGKGSDANQSLRGLLLEPGAEWDARPQLEIYTDDVSAAHGATVGNLDPEALFFLRSRGLDEDVSRRLLAGAFAREIAEQVGDERIASLLRDAVDAQLKTMLGGGT